MINALAYDPLAFASGLSIYATVAVLGLCSRTASLPFEQFAPSITGDHHRRARDVNRRILRGQIPWFDLGRRAPSCVPSVARSSRSPRSDASPTTQALAAPRRLRRDVNHLTKRARGRRQYERTVQQLAAEAWAKTSSPWRCRVARCGIRSRARGRGDAPSCDGAVRVGADPRGQRRFSDRARLP
jgi:hypothetical protein